MAKAQYGTGAGHWMARGKTNLHKKARVGVSCQVYCVKLLKFGALFATAASVTCPDIRLLPCHPLKRNQLSFVAHYALSRPLSRHLY